MYQAAGVWNKDLWSWKPQDRALALPVHHQASFVLLSALTLPSFFKYIKKNTLPLGLLLKSHTSSSSNQMSHLPESLLWLSQSIVASPRLLVSLS